jgi:hypothetical protein
MKGVHSSEFTVHGWKSAERKKGANRQFTVEEKKYI